MVAHSEMFVESKVSLRKTRDIQYENNDSNWTQNNNDKDTPQRHPKTTGSEENSCLKIKQNGSIVLKLGQYRATVVPLLVLLFCKTCGDLSMGHMTVDERTIDLPLMSSPWPTFFLCAFYVVFSLVWGPRLMEHRPAFKLRKTMMLYNVIQVILCSYMFIEVGVIGWFFDYNYRCQPADFSRSDKAMRMTRVAYLFFLSKILDFTDTVFFVLNKKFSHISLLHVVHHSCMTYSVMAGTRYIPGGHSTFLGYFNSAVHVLMYSYYLLAAMGPSVRPYLWWKKYLTTIQLVQFVIVFLHSAQLLFIDCPDVPKGIAVWTCIYAVIFFGLFMDFYNKTYKSKAPVTDASSVKTYKSGSLMNKKLKSPSKLSFILEAVSCMRETR